MSWKWKQKTQHTHHAFCFFQTLRRSFALSHHSISYSLYTNSIDPSLFVCFVADDVSLLVVTLDTNPFFWSTFPFPFAEFLSQVTLTQTLIQHFTPPIPVSNFFFSFLFPGTRFSQHDLAPRPAQPGHRHRHRMQLLRLRLRFHFRQEPWLHHWYNARALFQFTSQSRWVSR